MQCIKCSSPIPEGQNRLCNSCEKELQANLSIPKHAWVEKPIQDKPWEIPVVAQKIISKEIKTEISNGKAVEHANSMVNKKHFPLNYLAWFFIILATIILGILIGIFFYYPILN